MTGWEQKTDAELLSRIQEGSHLAFAALVRRHSGQFYRLAYRFTRQQTEAEDIVQDAFIKLWAHPGLWRPGANVKFTTWFYRIIVNRCLDSAKKKKPIALPDEMQIADARPSQEQEAIFSETQRKLEKEIAALPARQRTALNLCFHEELSNQEAADIMGVKLKALQSLLMRAKTTLKETMRP